MEQRRRFLMGLAAAALAGAARASFANTDKGGPKQLRWDDLVPKGWNPLDEYRKAHPMLEGDSPEGMQAMREIWDNAPVLKTLDGQTVKLPGYVVPLEAIQDAMREFLLVPYFGACIHAPAPPANQVIHAVVDKAVNTVKLSPAMWISGTIRTVRSDTRMGVSGYEMTVDKVDPYKLESSPMPF